MLSLHGASSSGGAQRLIWCSGCVELKPLEVGLVVGSWLSFSHVSFSHKECSTVRPPPGSLSRRHGAARHTLSTDAPTSGVPLQPGHFCSISSASASVLILVIGCTQGRASRECALSALLCSAEPLTRGCTSVRALTSRVEFIWRAVARTYGQDRRCTWEGPRETAFDGEGHLSPEVHAAATARRRWREMALFRPCYYTPTSSLGGAAAPSSSLLLRPSPLQHAVKGPSPALGPQLRPAKVGGYSGTRGACKGVRWWALPGWADLEAGCGNVGVPVVDEKGP